jgi:hypothetical protein
VFKHFYGIALNTESIFVVPIWSFQSVSFLYPFNNDENTHILQSDLSPVPAKGVPAKVKRL